LAALAGHDTVIILISLTRHPGLAPAEGFAASATLGHICCIEGALAFALMDAWAVRAGEFGW